MCFGNTTEKTTSTTNTPDPQVQAATTQNLGWLSGIQKGGMPAIPDNRVGDFGPLQNQGFESAATTAANPDYLHHAQDLVNQYSSNPAGHVLTSNIYSGTQPYMDQYNADALKPQLNDLENQRNAALHSSDRAATMAGAFGDPRAAIDRDLTNNRFDMNRQGLIGQGYNQAFDRAIGASAQDVANSNNAQTANAGLTETYLNRLLQGANANTGLQKGQMDIAGLLNSLGLYQTQQNQAKAQVPFQDWMIQNMQWIPQIAQLMNQSITAGTKGLPSNSTAVTSAPDNSGFGALGSILGSYAGSAGGSAAISSGLGSIGSALGSLGPLAIFSDIQLKEEVEPIGELFDGTPVYSYRYIDDPVTHIGLMAQDIEDRVPEAVHDIGGFKAVDYEMATRPARAMWLADALGVAA